MNICKLKKKQVIKYHAEYNPIVFGSVLKNSLWYIYVHTED